MACPGRILRRAPHPMVGLARTRTHPSRRVGLGRGRLRDHLGLRSSLNGSTGARLGGRAVTPVRVLLYARRDPFSSTPCLFTFRGKAVFRPLGSRRVDRPQHPFALEVTHEPHRCLCDRFVCAVLRRHWRHRCGGTRQALRVAARPADAEPNAPAESGSYAPGADAHPAGARPDASTAGARSHPDASAPGANPPSHAARDSFRRSVAASMKGGRPPAHGGGGAGGRPARTMPPRRAAKGRRPRVRVASALRRDAGRGGERDPRTLGLAGEQLERPRLQPRRGMGTDRPGRVVVVGVEKQ